VSKIDRRSKKSKIDRKRAMKLLLNETTTYRCGEGTNSSLVANQHHGREEDVGADDSDCFHVVAEHFHFLVFAVAVGVGVIDIFD
jgi:hypothetical protein